MLFAFLAASYLTVEAPDDALRDLFRRRAQQSQLALLFTAAATLLGALLALRGLLPGRRDLAVLAWERLCRKLARAGLERSPSEGPHAFASRVAAARPDLAPAVLAIADAYVQIRYRPADPGRPAAALADELRRRIRRLKT
jgi:hypothetical protein